MLRSASLRLAVAFAALFVFSSSLLVGALWWTTSGYLDREINAVILSEASALAEQSALDRDCPASSRRSAGAWRRAATRRRSICSPTRSCGRWSATSGLAGAGRPRRRLVRGRGRAQQRGPPRAAVHFILPANLHLLVGRDIQDRRRVCGGANLRCVAVGRT
jgi:hypothetical protein